MDSKGKHPQVRLDIDSQSQPVNVPAFTCVVYVSQNDAGEIYARVGNLSEIECHAATERAALSKIVPAFKQRVTQFLSKDEPIPWIDPPLPRTDDEQERLLPVHL